jgi:hypothetical protein
MKTINLTQGLFVYVDDEDYQELSKYKWNAAKNKNCYYVVRNQKINGKYKTIYMHREVLKYNGKLAIDHIDGNGLNNCKSNLRTVTIRQNGQNIHKTNKTSIYPGVNLHKPTNRWRSQIVMNGKQTSLGYYDNEIDAYNAYRKALNEMNETFVEEVEHTSFFNAVN